MSEIEKNSLADITIAVLPWRPGEPVRFSPSPESWMLCGTSFSVVLLSIDFALERAHDDGEDVAKAAGDAVRDLIDRGLVRARGVNVRAGHVPMAGRGRRAI